MSVDSRRKPACPRIDHVGDRQLLERIESADHVLVGRQQIEDALRIEADVGIDEHEVRRAGVVEHLRHQVVPRPGHQAVIGLSVDRPDEADFLCREHETHEAGEECLGELPAVAGQAEMHEALCEIERHVDSTLDGSAPDASTTTIARRGTLPRADRRLRDRCLRRSACQAAVRQSVSVLVNCPDHQFFT